MFIRRSNSNVLKKQNLKTFFFYSSFPRVANLIIKKVHSNIFITLCDLNRRVIISKSSGTVRRIGRNKKRKIAPHAVEIMTKSLKKYFIFYRIKEINLYIKLNKCAHLYILLKELRYLFIKVRSIIDIRRVPHNGMRGRKIRRI